MPTFEIEVVEVIHSVQTRTAFIQVEAESAEDALNSLDTQGPDSFDPQWGKSHENVTDDTYEYGPITEVDTCPDPMDLAKAAMEDACP